MKKTWLLMTMVCVFILSGIPAYAAWFLDTTAYQSSVHGNLSCMDCHDAISEKDLHPDPAEINIQLSELFDQDQCIGCHEEILEDLEQGSHGSKRVEDREEYEYCIDCHDPHYQTAIEQPETKPVPSSLPALSEEDIACMTCHAAADPNDPVGKEHIRRLCFHCHASGETRAQEKTAKIIPLIKPEKYAFVPHAKEACTVCHVTAAAFPHSNQQRIDCMSCHPPHHEKVAHAAHLSVSCEVCHLQGAQPLKAGAAEKIQWEAERNLTQPLNIHHMAVTKDESFCRRCHRAGNRLGAASMVLPAKSVLCMPCHAATFSVSDTTSIVALAVFAFGIIMMFSYVLTGSIEGRSESSLFLKLMLLIGNGLGAIFSKRIVPIVHVIFWDVLLQRRLFRLSFARWAIHSLIFMPFAFRFLWGIVALVASLLTPEWTTVWSMLNKNHPVTAFVFDLTGIMITIGLLLAFVRGKRTLAQRFSGLPEQDRWVLGLIAAIVTVGFILEGIRIAMAGWPQGAGFAFIGYAISRLFVSATGLNEWYGYIWYLHAILTGVFIAYLPFSRLIHIILAPVVLSMRAVSDVRH
ncbi:MAG: respiratory nitrate reductase subunit gamma [Deltaproteobacteria bacterium]|nr:respiratory nitrate reductase subunit gamma [Deltaproteobacteria bacterium]MBW1960635.1 respiratory nitrate reductase subunit gamma [Deltaproteobacteria bacterium]MBW2150641.1 respiratory nitrate reductase subunit gamma [Deltaproteobacteria bacterium]